jgi:hypothetical protein
MYKCKKKYINVIEQFKQPCFITLTLPDDSYNLKDCIAHMEEVWQAIRKSWENKKRKIKGIKKIECSIKNKRFHFHFHFIIEGIENAEWVKQEWLRRNSNASKNAQQLEEIKKDSIETLLIYFLKPTVEISRDDKVIDTTASEYYQQLDKVFLSMRSRRTYQTFGGIKFDEEKTTNKNTEQLPLFDIRA